MGFMKRSNLVQAKAGVESNGGASPISIASIGKVTRTLTEADMVELDKLRAENARLKAGQEKGAPRALTFKVSEKGAVSVYGMGRFPVTLYQEQWNRLIEAMPELRAFIEANASQLKVKE